MHLSKMHRISLPCTERTHPIQCILRMNHVHYVSCVQLLTEGTTHKRSRSILLLFSDQYHVLSNCYSKDIVWNYNSRKPAAQRYSMFLSMPQSYLINMDHITEVKDTFILHDGTRIPYRIRKKRRSQMTITDISSNGI